MFHTNNHITYDYYVRPKDFLHNNNHLNSYYTIKRKFTGLKKNSLRE